MRRHTFWIGLCGAMVLAGTTWAEPDSNREGPALRMELDLVDGSHVIGVPSIEALPVETSYAKMSVPLSQIQTLQIGEDHETVSFLLRNGDKLKGVINLELIKLETVFGKAAIRIEHIRALRVVLPGRSLPETMKKGLVLHFSFDRDETGTVTDQSGKNNNGTVFGAKWTPQGMVGGAYEFSGSSKVESGGAPLDLSELTVSAWFKTTRSAGNQVLLAKHRPGSDNGYFLMLDWASSPQGKLYFYHSAPGSKFGSVNGAARSVQNKLNDGKWHHVVAGRSATKVFVCVDGVFSSTDGSGQYISNSEPLRVGMFDTSSGVDGVIDEVMIFDRAMSESEVQQFHEAQK